MTITNEKLVLKLVKIMDAFEFGLNEWKETGFRGGGILVEDFLDNEIQMLYDLIEELAGFDNKDDRISEILFDETLTSNGKLTKIKKLDL